MGGIRIDDSSFDEALLFIEAEENCSKEVELSDT